MTDAIAERDRGEVGRCIASCGETQQVAATRREDARQLHEGIDVLAGGEPDGDRPRHRPDAARGIERPEGRSRIVRDVQLEDVDAGFRGRTCAGREVAGEAQAEPGAVPSRLVERRQHHEADSPRRGRALGDQPVVEHDLAQPERHRHRRRRGDGPAALGGRTRGEPILHRRHQLRIARPQVLVAHAEAACEQAVCELPGLEPAVVALGLLEPLEAGLRRALQPLHQRSPLGLVRRQRRRHVTADADVVRQRDGVFHRQLRSGADGEVRGVGGVAHQHDAPVVPARVAHGRELPPDGTIRQDPVPGQLAREEPLGERGRRRLVRAVEAGAAPRGLRRLEDEGRVLAVVTVGVHAPEPVGVLLEDEGKSGKRKRRAEPDEAVRPPVDLRAEPVRIGRTHPGVGTVGGQHEVGVGVAREVVHLRREAQGDAERGAARL